MNTEEVTTLELENNELRAFCTYADKESESPLIDLRKVAGAEVNTAFASFITAPIENKAGYGHIERMKQVAGAGNEKDTFDVYHCVKGEADPVKNGTLVTSIERGDLLARAEVGEKIQELVAESIGLAPMLVKLVRKFSTGKKVVTRGAFTC